VRLFVGGNVGLLFGAKLAVVRPEVEAENRQRHEVARAWESSLKRMWDGYKLDPEAALFDEALKRWWDGYRLDPEEALVSVDTARKLLRSQGVPEEEIDARIDGMILDANADGNT
jgi:hypothetical protein